MWVVVVLIPRLWNSIYYIIRNSRGECRVSTVAEARKFSGIKNSAISQSSFTESRHWTALPLDSRTQFLVASGAKQSGERNERLTSLSYYSYRESHEKLNPIGIVSILQIMTRDKWEKEEWMVIVDYGGWALTREFRTNRSTILIQHLILQTHFIWNAFDLAFTSPPFGTHTPPPINAINYKWNLEMKQLIL